MSGGHYDYAYHQLERLADDIQEIGCEHCVPPKTRRAFRALLYRVAKAARAIEWNDSGDGADDEASLIKACFTTEDKLIRDKIPKQKKHEED